MTNRNGVETVVATEAKIRSLPEDVQVFVAFLIAYEREFGLKWLCRTMRWSRGKLRPYLRGDRAALPSEEEVTPFSEALGISPRQVLEGTRRPDEREEGLLADVIEGDAKNTTSEHDAEVKRSAAVVDGRSVWDGENGRTTAVSLGVSIPSILANPAEPQYTYRQRVYENGALVGESVAQIDKTRVPDPSRLTHRLKGI